MTIYILDSHPLMCQAIAFLLRRIDASKNAVEVHAFSKLQEAMLVNSYPEAFIVDPLMLGFSVATGIRQLRSNYPDTPIILLSSMPSSEAEAVCLKAGADLYIEKTTPVQIIFDLIGLKLGLIDEAVKNTKKVSAEGVLKLSKRQKQLLALIDSGLSNEDAARKLDISPHTVKVHLWRLYGKLNIKSRTQLIKFARENGYL